MIKDMIVCLKDKFKFDCEKSGYNIVMTKEFVFVSPIDKPYYVHDNIDIFNSIFSIVGMVHIPSF